MNDVLAALLKLIRDEPGVELRELRGDDQLAIAELARRGHRATLLANPALAPLVGVAGKRKQYGSYTISGDSRGDWVKGDDAHECLAYILAWFDGVAARRNEVSAFGGRVEAPSEGVPSGILGVVAEELMSRAPLESTGPGVLVTLDGRSVFSLHSRGSMVVVAAEGRVYTSTNASIGVCVAGILGFLDGLSLDSDE